MDRATSMGGSSGRPGASQPASAVVGDPLDLPTLDYELQQLGVKVTHQVCTTPLEQQQRLICHCLCSTYLLSS